MDGNSKNKNTNEAMQTFAKIANMPGAKLNFENRDHGISGASITFENKTENKNWVASSDDPNIKYPSGNVRDTIEEAVGKSYILKDQDGNLLPNLNSSLNLFDEADRSLDFKIFCDVRVIPRGARAYFQTDSIVNSKASETNSIYYRDQKGDLILDSDGNPIPTGGGASNSHPMVLRNEVVINNVEKGTDTTEINVRDMSDISAVDLLSSNMAQHQRMNRLATNRFVLALMLKNALITDSGASFDYTKTGIFADIQYIRLGQALYPRIRQEIVDAQEVMTIQRPGGFDGASDLFVLVAPLIYRALVDYQSSLPSSDKAFIVGATGELYGASIEGVPIYKSNLMKGGQKLVVNGVTEFENTGNVEMLIGYNGYVKYVEAEPFVQSTQFIIDHMPQPFVVGQRTEGMHNGIVIVKNLFKGYMIERIYDAAKSKTTAEQDETYAAELVNNNPKLGQFSFLQKLAQKQEAQETIEAKAEPKAEVKAEVKDEAEAKEMISYPKKPTAKEIKEQAKVAKAEVKARAAKQAEAEVEKQHKATEPTKEEVDAFDEIQI